MEPRQVLDDSASVGWQFEHGYAQLPDLFFASAVPEKATAPSLAIVNYGLGHELGLALDRLTDDAAAALFAGQALPLDSRPIAQAYAGHQFGGFTMLGDGRAILLGEHRTPSGQLVDIQLKGAGRTRFSRGGDGRAALGPMLREYIISEAMHGLRIPTTRSLAVVMTGEPVYRMSTLKGAILTRVATSHIRVGTFQYVAALDNDLYLRALADYAIQRHYPQLEHLSDKYLSFLRAVMQCQASLVAQWQLVGFIHGVMNTDNMAISGETIDYGPCAFMNTYDPNTVFSSIDRNGRYAYGNQPLIAQWNLARLAESLLPLLDPVREQAIALATDTIGEFPSMFEHCWLAGMRKKLGLQSMADADLELIQTLLSWMHTVGADFTNTFRDLSTAARPSLELYQSSDFADWYDRWLSRLQNENTTLSAAAERMQAVNPVVIPRNHKVEEALDAAESQNDLSVMYDLLEVLKSPFNRSEAAAPYQVPPVDDKCYQTYCGT